MENSNIDNVQTEDPSIAQVVGRGLLSLIGGGLAYLAAFILLVNGFLSIIDVVYVSLVGVLIGLLIGAPLSKRIDRSWQEITKVTKRIPPQAILAAIVGTTIALIITVLLNSLFDFTWYWSLAFTSILVTASSWFFVTNRQLFNVFLSRSSSTSSTQFQSSTSSKSKLIDTSAIIDGRILDIIDANFIDGQFLIPKFILNELQNIADSSDVLRRNRGRRGLEVLDKLVNQQRIPVKVITEDVPDVLEVDEKLIRLCQARRAALVTTDYNLSRVAALQNIKVLNVHQLANAVRAMFLPGERLSLHIVKEGREVGQGLAYLEDGTMVVIEGGQKSVGQTLDVIVTSNLQTNMGRMIFARPHSEAD